MESIIQVWDYLELNPSPIVEIKDSFRENICKKIIEKYGNYKSFSRSVQIPYTSLYNYLLKKSRNIIRLNQLSHICKKLGIPKTEIEDNILALRPKKYKNFLLPLELKVTKNLASLVGHCIGDGHIEKTYNFVYTNRSKKLLNEVTETIKNTFKLDIEPKIIYHRAYSYNFPYVTGAVLTLSGAPLGDKKSTNFDTPHWIKNGSKEMKKYFIRAIFDDEATVKTKKREIVIKMAKIEKMEKNLDNFLGSLRNLLVSFNIHPSAMRFDNKHVSKKGLITIQKGFGIHGQENFKKFEKFIGFSHPKKRKFLSMMIKNCKIKKHRAYEAQNIILNLIKKPSTVGDISNKIRLRPLAVYKNLRKLEKRKLAIQIKFSKNEPSLWKKANSSI